jgi:ubiquinone/menaquinone biosynthesis C-methylase UbiE
MILLVTVYHEIVESEVILREFGRVLKPEGKIVVVEVIKKGIFPGAPVQNPKALTTEIEASDFKLKKMTPHKIYGIFSFSKKA